MMLTRIQTTFLVFVLFVFSSCSSVYMPNVPNTPMLSSQGELSAGGHVSLKGNVSVNAAYAAGNHLGILLNGSIMNNRGSKREFNHNLIEAGAGYFTPFGEGDRQIFEVYAGFGRGSSLTTRKEATPTGVTVTEQQDVGFRKYFMQVNYSAKDKDGFQLFGKKIELNYGTALRLSYVDMNRFLLNNQAHAPEDNIFFEPVFFTRTALSKNVQLQYTGSTNLGLRNRKYLTAGNSIFTLGIVVNVGGNRP
ncbi:hypothetical protein [Pedobacter yulinensis]|nr:hypothetical protein [Pedobacter yulinensis]